MLRIQLDISPEGGSPATVVLERSRPEATLTVSVGDQRMETTVPARDLDALVRALQQCQLALLPASPFMGLAKGYALSVEVDLTSATFRWAHVLPAGWEPLAPVVGAMRSLACRLAYL